MFSNLAIIVRPYKKRNHNIRSKLNFHVIFNINLFFRQIFISKKSENEDDIRTALLTGSHILHDLAFLYHHFHRIFLRN
ncbi:hypothetical protein BpHYR1_024267 [Brachionus plicatilis]|uniref:Uncharacterized protein n=1 Tax=Brachionus plicatilis TaxID=10195 RepID=A0A3M7P7W2_BRAPC|nr:hypothetical protein BpHYR1_024267 [Brachionus plicatilis]